MFKIPLEFKCIINSNAFKKHYADCYILFLFWFSLLCSVQITMAALKRFELIT